MIWTSESGRTVAIKEPYRQHRWCRCLWSSREILRETCSSCTGPPWTRRCFCRWSPPAHAAYQTPSCWCRPSCQLSENAHKDYLPFNSAKASIWYSLSSDLRILRALSSDLNQWNHWEHWLIDFNLGVWLLIVMIKFPEWSVVLWRQSRSYAEALLTFGLSIRNSRQLRS